MPSMPTESLANTDVTPQSDRAHSSDIADWFNSGCACVTLNRNELVTHLAQQLDHPTADALAHHFPGLFSNVALFLPTAEFRAMQQVIEAIETVTSLPAYQKQVLAQAPAIASHNPGASGVFMGYDFHRAGDSPKLIEINTNAGGAFLNAALRRSQQACCPEMAALLWPPVNQDFEASVLAMFREEWARQRAHAPLTRIAIVDDKPSEQFLYPEFLLAQQMFRQHGIDAVVADPGELQLRDNGLFIGAQAIDLVYNRLTDFLLDDPAHAVLKEAYQRDKVVLTPHPHVYALYADKRNLIALGNRAQLQQWQLPDAVQDTLCRSIPETVSVEASNAEQLWQQRKQWFFKPARGYGSKASYRGDKLTRKTWQEIVGSNYIAQAFAPPSERLVNMEGNTVNLKTDVRIYRYAGRTLLIAARLYQGQTTNMRTPGGGFAPVFLI